jgi:four helix bundle protein
MVYQASLKFVTCAAELIAGVEGRAAVKDQLDRASTSIPLNIAEGNGKFSVRDRCRFLDFACGSALECASTIDSGKNQLVEIVSMLMGLINSLSTRVGETPGTYSLSHAQEQE